MAFYFSVCLLHLRATRTLAGSLYCIAFFFFFSPNVDELIADRRFVETFGHCLVVLSCTACQYMRMYVIHVHVVDQQLGSIPEPECGVR